MSRLIVTSVITTLAILASGRVPGQEKDQPSPKELLAEIARLKEEVKAALNAVRIRDQNIVRLNEELKRSRKELIAALTALEATKVQLEKLQEQMLEKDRIIAALRAAAGEKVTKNPNFPGKFVKGTITKVDATERLVEIDLGKVAGIAKGHHLEVYRVKPRAEYLGRIRILEVYEEKSVGRLETRLAKNQVLQVGDSVASQLEKK